MPETDEQSELTRREALASAAVGGCVSVAGCASLTGADRSGTVLGKVEVINSSRVRNRIRLLVDRDDGTGGESDDDRLVDRTISLAAIDAGTGTSVRVIQPVWSQSAGHYTIRAVHIDRSGERETSDWDSTFTQDDYETYSADTHEDPGCIGAIVTVGTRADTENAAIGIGPTYMENPCGRPESG